MTRVGCQALHACRTRRAGAGLARGEAAVLRNGRRQPLSAWRPRRVPVRQRPLLRRCLPQIAGQAAARCRTQSGRAVQPAHPCPSPRLGRQRCCRPAVAPPPCQPPACHCCHHHQHSLRAAAKPSLYHYHHHHRHGEQEAGRLRLAGQGGRELGRLRRVHADPRAMPVRGMAGPMRLAALLPEHRTHPSLHGSQLLAMQAAAACRRSPPNRRQKALGMAGGGRTPAGMQVAARLPRCCCFAGWPSGRALWRCHGCC